MQPDVSNFGGLAEFLAGLDETHYTIDFEILRHQRIWPNIASHDVSHKFVEPLSPKKLGFVGFEAEERRKSRCQSECKSEVHPLPDGFNQLFLTWGNLHFLGNLEFKKGNFEIHCVSSV